MVLTPGAAFSIPEFGHIFACSTTTRGPMAKWMVPLNSGCQIGLVRNSQGLADCSGGISKVVLSPRAALSIPKFRHIFCSRATARHRRLKRMARGDLAHLIGLVRDPQCLVDCSGSISKVVNTLLLLGGEVRVIFRKESS